MEEPLQASALHLPWSPCPQKPCGHIHVRTIVYYDVVWPQVFFQILFVLYLAFIKLLRWTIYCIVYKSSSMKVKRKVGEKLKDPSRASAYTNTRGTQVLSHDYLWEPSWGGGVKVGAIQVGRDPPETAICRLMMVGERDVVSSGRAFALSRDVLSLSRRD